MTSRTEDEITVDNRSLDERIEDLADHIKERIGKFEKDPAWMLHVALGFAEVLGVLEEMRNRVRKLEEWKRHMMGEGNEE